MAFDVFDTILLILMGSKLQSQPPPSVSENPDSHPRSPWQTERSMLRIWTVLIAPLHIMEQSAAWHAISDHAVPASGVIRWEQHHHRSYTHFCVHLVLLPGLLVRIGQSVQMKKARQLGRGFGFIGISIIIKVSKGALVRRQRGNLQCRYFCPYALRKRFTGIPCEDGVNGRLYL